jgi:hypothetical protein
MEQIELGIEVKLNTPDDFLKIKETLTRLGIKSKKSKTFYQSCSILHKRGTYRILHFKELFALDGRKNDISSDDLRRRNEIATMLENWGMCKILDKKSVELRNPEVPVDILQYKEKKDWTLLSKYTVGKKKL